MKKLRPEVISSIEDCSLDLYGMMDQFLLHTFNITEDELQFIHDNATNQELETFVNGLGKWEQKPTFSEIRNLLEVRNKYLLLKKQI